MKVRYRKTGRRPSEYQVFTSYELATVFAKHKPAGVVVRGGFSERPKEWTAYYRKNGELHGFTGFLSRESATAWLVEQKEINNGTM